MIFNSGDGKIVKRFTAGTGAQIMTRNEFESEINAQVVIMFTRRRPI